MGFLRRQVITAALTANAVRPFPGYEVGVPAFFAGWLTGELAPHVLALTTADAAANALGLTYGRRPHPLGLALAGASAVGLSFVIAQGRLARQQAEDALSEALGEEWVDGLETAPSPADLAVPWRQLVYPFRMRNREVRVERDIAYNDHGKRGLLDVYFPRERAGRGSTRAAPGARRRVDDRQEGPAGHPAHAAPGRQGVGLRGDQLPSRPARPVPGPHHRRQAGDRLDPREHLRLRRRPRLHRDHRWIGRRPPRLPSPL